MPKGRAKKINGKIFFEQESHRVEKLAQNEAKGWERKGYNYNIHKSTYKNGKPKFTVFVRKKGSKLN